MTAAMDVACFVRINVTPLLFILHTGVGYCSNTKLGQPPLYWWQDNYNRVRLQVSLCIVPVFLSALFFYASSLPFHLHHLHTTAAELLRGRDRHSGGDTEPRQAVD